MNQRADLKYKIKELEELNWRHFYPAGSIKALREEEYKNTLRLLHSIIFNLRCAKSELGPFHEGELNAMITTAFQIKAFFMSRKFNHGGMHSYDAYFAGQLSRTLMSLCDELPNGWEENTNKEVKND